MKFKVLKSYMLMSALALGATTLLVQPSFAERGDKGERPYKERKWGGEDGKMSKSEFMKRQAERFAKMDRDGDGYVGRGEAKAMHEKMKKHKGKHGEYGEKMHERMENMSDEEKAEFREKMKKRHEKMKNMSPEEREEFREEMKEKRGNWKKRKDQSED